MSQKAAKSTPGHWSAWRTSSLPRAPTPMMPRRMRSFAPSTVAGTASVVARPEANAPRNLRREFRCGELSWLTGNSILSRSWCFYSMVVSYCMLTRFSKPTCPKCGYIGKPRVAGEIAGLVGFIPIVGDIATMHDTVNATLHCSKYGEPLTESLLEKTKNLKDSVGDKVAKLKESIQEAGTSNAFCASCGRPLLSGARFCNSCGTAKPQ